MKWLISLSVAVLLVLTWSDSAFSVEPNEHNKVVCFWNTTAFERSGAGKFTIEEVKPALPLCTHLIYGFAGINAETFEIVPLNPTLDTGAGYAYYRLVPQLKRQFPELKIYLSVGGNADPEEDTHKYLTLTETPANKNKFINSVMRLFSDYDFDGLDLAWQFPQVKVKKERSTLGSLWHGLKSKAGFGKFKDEHQEEHRGNFSILVQDLRTQLRSKNKALTLTVLPHINSSVYYDVRALTPYLDAVHIFAFDQVNPIRTPKIADYPAPMDALYNRVPEDNVKAQTSYWKHNGFPGSKIVLGIPSFARTWTLDEDTESITGVPPIPDAAGPGPAGPNTGIPGVLSYAEVCARLTEHAVGRLRRVNDPKGVAGSYAYKAYDKKAGAPGIWVGFEDPEVAGRKANYVKSEGLGGVAIYDLSLDDFRGVCNGDKFPIVKAAKFKL